MTEKRVIPWAEIREKYEAGEGSYAALGRRYGVSGAAVGKRARREHWAGRRTGQKSEKSAMEDCLASAARQLRRSVEETMECGENVSVKELKELTVMLRELMNLEQAVSDRERMEEAQRGQLRIVMEEDTAAYSQ